MQILEDNPLGGYQKKTTTFPLNQVLYGVSGTGKTYLAPYYALAIIEGVALPALLAEAHEEVMARFRVYQQQGFIEWLTLHKGYSYETLIQAQTPAKKDGLWKLLADRAQAQYDFFARPKHTPTFEEWLNLYIAKHIHPDTEEIEFPLLVKKRDYVAIVINRVSTEALYYKRKSKNQTLQEGEEYCLQMETLANLYAQNYTNTIENADYQAVIHALKAYSGEQADTSGSLKNYVLVLDEMQSVDLPALLGEGLSLLEADRRTGKANALSITLPTGDVLRFPPNLYLVGTWNTSDCPLPSNSGLLRRFAWITCPTRYDLIENESLRIFCEALNEALERELGMAYPPIGHTYFLGKQESELDVLLSQHLLPLMKEFLHNQNKKILHIVENARAKAGL